MTADDRVLLVIGSGLSVYREYLIESAARRAAELDLKLVLVNNLKPTWQHDYFDEITVVNVFDHDELRAAAREIAGRRTVVGLFCYDEPLVMPAAELAAEFGVPGLGLAGVEGCRDKHRTRSMLTAAGLPQPGFELTDTLEQAREVAARIGYPVVVKPRALGASMGVVLAEDETQLDQAYLIASNASLVGDEPYRGGAIVEGYADGPEISVDGVVHQGEYRAMFVARKETGHYPYFEEVGHVVDAADPLLEDQELIGVLTKAHEVLGVENGLTHTEVKLTTYGPVIIEINGRLGGDLIPFLGRIATGIDPGELLVEVAAGHRPDTAFTRHAVAGIRFGYPTEDATVREVRVPTDLPGLVTASPMVEPGIELRLPPGGYLARHSFVVCTGEDRRTCAERLDTAIAAVELDAEPLERKDVAARLEMPAGLLDADV
ncbi:ATP-grasp domain-containing protein [Streptomyces ipomoeae]|uniref:ATP-grasp domain-containing protein n=1 Tax=Streptomyces ipomoeae TaxID=103232 RepID=UPI001146E28A|nr:ATP-grasp domain-containing protein [Streptomyces ipomoeae]MDX2934601.1 ATP-grasp domain-containing protein [Streptomyces ipomoeae]TQE19001.1 ATP-grasp domain-containing protein [Streptomyces ipomoeae]